MGINKSIELDELKSRFSDLKSLEFGVSSKNNIYVKIENVLYFITSDGKKVPKDTPHDKVYEKVVFKELNNKDVLDRILTIIDEENAESD